MFASPDLPVFRAIADPTRRAMLNLLTKGERAVNDLLASFDMTQPAISQHLKVLREAGLVSERRQGRQRIYRLDPLPLKAVHDWTAHYERFWLQKFTDLGDFLDQLPEEATESASKSKRPTVRVSRIDADLRKTNGNKSKQQRASKTKRKTTRNRRRKQ